MCYNLNALSSADAEGAKRKTALSSKARAEEKKLTAVIDEYNLLLEGINLSSTGDTGQHPVLSRQPADKDAIVDAARRPAEVGHVNFPFPWLDRAAQDRGTLQNDKKMCAILHSCVKRRWL